MAYDKLIKFDEVRNNNIKSFFLFVLFLLMIVGLGYIAGLFMGNILGGIILTVIFGLIYSGISYFQGRNMVMSTMGGEEVSKKDYTFLHNTVEGLAIAADIPKPKVYVVESKAPNAFATGRNPEDGAVAVTTGLLEKLEREEVEGVIAHEIAHIKNNDIKTMMIAAVMVGIVVLLSDVIMHSMIWGGGRSDDRGGAILFIIGIVLAILAPIIAQIIKLAVSRKREYAADAKGAILNRNPKALADALRKISGDGEEFDRSNRATNHLLISMPANETSRFSSLFSTHPPIQDRIDRLEAM